MATNPNRGDTFSAHPLTNAADLLERAAGLVEDAAREVALAAAQAPVTALSPARSAMSHPTIDQGSDLPELARYAGGLAQEATALSVRSYVCRSATGA